MKQFVLLRWIMISEEVLITMLLHKDARTLGHWVTIIFLASHVFCRLSEKSCNVPIIGNYISQQEIRGNTSQLSLITRFNLTGE